MSCLRENRTRLLEVMEVFVNEPLLDWIQQASTAIPASSAQSTEENEWKLLVTSRVHVADLKIRGIRPSFVMSAELRERKNKNGVESCVGFICRAAGIKPETCHSKLSDGDNVDWIKNPLAVHDQVDELIKIATSGSVLMRQWIGWRSWI